MTDSALLCPLPLSTKQTVSIRLPISIFLNFDACGFEISCSSVSILRCRIGGHLVLCPTIRGVVYTVKTRILWRGGELLEDKCRHEVKEKRGMRAYSEHTHASAL